jgi:hypothetical protein
MTNQQKLIELYNKNENYAPNCELKWTLDGKKFATQEIIIIGMVRNAELSELGDYEKIKAYGKTVRDARQTLELDIVDFDRVSATVANAETTIFDASRYKNRISGMFSNIYVP